MARLAVVLLTEPGHEGQIYDVSGPHAIDLHETARILTRATRRVITYHPETLDEARASRAGHPDWLVDGWIGSYLMLDTGEGSVTSHTIEHLTGQAPDDPVRVPRRRTPVLRPPARLSSRPSNRCQR